MGTDWRAPISIVVMPPGSAGGAGAAVSSCASCARLIPAFRSRSVVFPRSSQWNARTSRDSLVFTVRRRVSGASSRVARRVARLAPRRGHLRRSKRSTPRVRVLRPPPRQAPSASFHGHLYKRNDGRICRGELVEAKRFRSCEPTSDNGARCGYAQVTSHQGSTYSGLRIAKTSQGTASSQIAAPGITAPASRCASVFFCITMPLVLLGELPSN